MELSVRSVFSFCSSSKAPRNLDALAVPRVQLGGPQKLPNFENITSARRHGENGQALLKREAQIIQAGMRLRL